MAEEHRCQAQKLCVNNCGFFGSPATMNLCSRCYREHQSKEEQASSAKIAVEKSLLGSSSSDPPRSPAAEEACVAEESDRSAAVAAVAVDRPGRCGECKRKVGLMGFKCRCGMTYCGGHRYPEQHACGFDFKAAGREAIARANPVVKAEKIERI